jgi:hypothetical protein
MRTGTGQRITLAFALLQQNRDTNSRVDFRAE